MRPQPDADLSRLALRAAYRENEAHAVARCLAVADRVPDLAARSAPLARRLVGEMRRRGRGKGGVDALLSEYALSSEEGIALMCLAEALLRVPDAETVDRLIRDKLAPADWARHLGHSPSLFVNASTWALMLTGRLIQRQDDLAAAWTGVLRRLVARSGEPVIRQAVTTAMRILGRQFVLGRTIEEALTRARAAEAQGYGFSYDMLGEAACTAADAARYAERYRHALGAIGASRRGPGGAVTPSLSVKLSALHPRYEESQRQRAVPALIGLVSALAEQAKIFGIGLTLDAEEADRLELSLDVLEAVAADPALAGWNGLGLAVQAYQKRALPLVDWLAGLARRTGRRLPVRLVKGAYWDSEIKRSQERGLADYPVYTRKISTDVSYLAAAQALLAAPDAVFPQFATHNAATLAAVHTLAGDRRDYEFQRLHGMGETLYAQIVGPDGLGLACRVYAPVGGHEDLLAYLVRRLLENGANTSFVHRLADEQAPIEEIIADPVARVASLAVKPHPDIPVPSLLYGAERRNAKGLDLADRDTAAGLERALVDMASGPRHAAPLVAAGTSATTAREIVDPSDHRRKIGTVVDAIGADAEAALAHAVTAAPSWDRVPAAERASCLDLAADLLEGRMAAFMALIVREGGRIIPDALSEVREAIDYCRYYGQQARADFAAPLPLPGPTGERNSLALHGRGVFLCLSPWNFPLAIFLGQVTAALAAGNAVIAKPAEQTPLVAHAAIRLLHEAGVPPEIVQFLPGDGATLGAQLVADRRVAGVAFTGSTETARLINESLARRPGPIAPFIAETGGVNALIADSTALPEKLVADIVTSAFDSAGQRCSALRMLFIQADIADRVLEMLSGALAELVIGDPGLLSTDIGPLVDDAARADLEAHAVRMTRSARHVATATLPAGTEHGSFFAPRIFELDDAALLEREVFGPILHVVRWQSDRLDRVVAAVNASGYGLTLGIHSRIDETVRYIAERVRVGNIYVNRSIIGAVVGVQPFGGEGLSGTGPKAGGPHYLHRFAVERTFSVDTTAAGGNAGLLSLRDSVDR
jgi:RHH-type proline utilization regulon transcriptional repressor/proline dehydrogenase/delta 1-pyrroline-5-carboxylate dehydrogenase